MADVILAPEEKFYNWFELLLGKDFPGISSTLTSTMFVVNKKGPECSKLFRNVPILTSLEMSPF
jgi:hypothetical protein